MVSELHGGVKAVSGEPKKSLTAHATGLVRGINQASHLDLSQ